MYRNIFGKITRQTEYQSITKKIVLKLIQVYIILLKIMVLLNKRIKCNPKPFLKYSNAERRNK